MDIDLILDARAADTELAELGTLAEELGFAGVWVSSLLDGRDPFTNFGLLARATQRISMGPIAVNPWDMHPVRISAALHTLNEISAGRARIVIGGGGEALAALGLQPERRVRAVQECVEILRLAGKGERLDYAGQLYQVRGYQLGWLEASPPAVFVGANMPQMLRMSARVAAGIMLSDMPAPLAGAAVGTANEAAAANGRDADSLWFGSFTALHIHDDVQLARNEARRWLLLRGLFRPWVLETFLATEDVNLIMQSQPAFLKAFVEGTHEIEGIPDALADKLVDELTLTAAADSLDGVIAELQALRAAGQTAACLRLYADPARTMRLLADRVLPEL